jgi:hypothetical protein
LPSAPALFLTLAQDAHERRAAIAFDDIFVEHPAPQGTYPEDHGLLFDFFQELAAEVIFSFSAIEAFANENIPDDFVYPTQDRSKNAISLVKPDIERHVMLDEKLKRVLPQARGIPSPAGTKPWQEFKELKKVRDRLIHLKSLDRKSSGPEHQTIWGLMLIDRKKNFAEIAINVIGSFPSLTLSRRWFRLISTP